MISNKESRSEKGKGGASEVRSQSTNQDDSYSTLTGFSHLGLAVFNISINNLDSVESINNQILLLFCGVFFLFVPSTPFDPLLNFP